MQNWAELDCTTQERPSHFRVRNRARRRRSRRRRDDEHQGTVEPQATPFRDAPPALARFG